MKVLFPTPESPITQILNLVCSFVEDIICVDVKKFRYRKIIFFSTNQFSGNSSTITKYLTVSIKLDREGCFQKIFRSIAPSKH